jgi:O-antigen ligase
MVLTRTPATLYALQHGRATGSFILPGELAAYLIVLLPIAYAVARIARAPALRALAWTACAVGLSALVLSYSRAGWMGGAATIAFLVALQSGRMRRRGAVWALAAIAVGSAAVLALFNSHHDPSEDYTRISIWQAALQIIDRFPLTGVGPFDFPRLYALVHVPDADATAFHAHSLYLTFFAEGGAIMLAAFLWTAWVFVVELRARVARAEPASALLSLAVTAGLVGVAVQGLIDTMSIVIFGLWLPSMGLALAAARAQPPLSSEGIDL